MLTGQRGMTTLVAEAPSPLREWDVLDYVKVCHVHVCIRIRHVCDFVWVWGWNVKVRCGCAYGRECAGDQDTVKHSAQRF